MAERVTEMLSLGILALFISGVCSELYVTHSPSHVDYRPAADTLKLSELPDVISSAFGFEIEKDFGWNGLGVGDLFRRPKATVLVTVETPVGIQISHQIKYNTDEDVAEVDADSVAYNILNLAGEEEKPLVVDMARQDRVLEIRSHQPELFADVPPTADKLRDLFHGDKGIFDAAQMGTLNVSKNEDLNFVGELLIIQSVVNALKLKGSGIHGRLPNFFHFKVHSLESLMDSHGADSQQVADAHRLLDSFITKITSELRAIYKDNVVVEVLTTSPGGESRVARHLLQADAAPTAAPVAPVEGLAEPYDAMYPVTFNIILWLMVTLTLSVIGISYSIWFMDPGRDSIIYRMTSTRIKKD